MMGWDGGITDTINQDLDDRGIGGEGRGGKDLFLIWGKMFLGGEGLHEQGQGFFVLKRGGRFFFFGV